MSELACALLGVLAGVLLHAVVLDAASAVRDREKER